MTSALILVDLQNDCMPQGALPVPDGDHTIAVANQELGKYDHVVATQDWHPRNHGSFAANHDKRPGERVDLHGIDQILWPVHCVQGSPGAQFVSSLKQDNIDAVFQKGTDPSVDSYSGFFDNGRRKDTGLSQWLTDHDVTDVYVLGLATDYCVKFTALDAVSEGFSTHLIVAGCRGVELQPGDVEAAISEMKDAGIDIVG